MTFYIVKKLKIYLHLWILKTVKSGRIRGQEVFLMHVIMGLVVIVTITFTTLYVLLNQ